MVAPPATPKPQIGRPPGSLGFDYFMFAITFWPLAGAFADAYAHSNSPRLETFFTPWHGILYSGALAVIVSNLIVMRRNHALGYAWNKAVPAGYEMTVFGTILLVVAGISDLTWHTLFGIEKNIAAVVSPTHLLLATSLAIIFAGPLRSAISRKETLRGAQQVPLLLSATFTFTLICILTQFLNPLANLWAAYGDVDLFHNPPYPPIDPFITQSLGLASIAFFTALVMGFVLFLVRRWSLFPGALTIFLGFSMTVISGIVGSPNLIPAALVTGIVGDILLFALRPSAAPGPIPFRIFAFMLPVALWTAYYVDLLATVGLAWQVHLWVGSIFGAAIIGWALSYLVYPPVAE
ncbi:MAG: hypothetical protein H0X24_09240 [Ktedonobacterales bacterium]|nr:hypothetical protein [Ktedonobacterales bacterium]